MGEVVWLGRYPVKSMLGEDLASATLGDHGIDGDRRYALIDELTGLVASAKNPRKWRALLSMAARYDPDSRVLITLAGGLTIHGEDPALSGPLGRALDRSVRLASIRPGDVGIERVAPESGELTRGSLGGMSSFVDFADLHVVTTATIDALAAAHPAGTMDVRRFRPNMVVRMVDPVPFVENTWPGRTLAIGAQAAVRVVVPTPRCAVPTLAQADILADDPDVLRVAARLNRVPVLELGTLTCVGAYGTVSRTGRISVGDLVTVAA